MNKLYKDEFMNTENEYWIFDGAGEWIEWMNEWTGSISLSEKEDQN